MISRRANVAGMTSLAENTHKKGLSPHTNATFPGTGDPDERHQWDSPVPKLGRLGGEGKGEWPGNDGTNDFELQLRRRGRSGMGLVGRTICGTSFTGMAPKCGSRCTKVASSQFFPPKPILLLTLSNQIRNGFLAFLLERSPDLSDPLQELSPGRFNSDDNLVWLIAQGPIESGSRLEAQLLGNLGRNRHLVFPSQGGCHVP